MCRRSSRGGGPIKLRGRRAWCRQSYANASLITSPNPVRPGSYRTAKPPLAEKFIAHQTVKDLEDADQYQKRTLYALRVARFRSTEPLH